MKVCPDCGDIFHPRHRRTVRRGEPERVGADRVSCSAECAKIHNRQIARRAAVKHKAEYFYLCDRYIQWDGNTLVVDSEKLARSYNDVIREGHTLWMPAEETNGRVRLMRLPDDLTIEVV